MEKRSLVIRGKKLVYWVNSSRSTTTIVFLHGFRGNHKGLLELADNLRQFKVIMLDLPGYGESEPLAVTHNFIEYARILNEFYLALGLKESVIVGHSFGASLGIVFSALYSRRVQKLILLTPVTYADTIEAKAGKSFYQIATVLPPFLRTFWLKSPLFDFVSTVVILKTSHIQRRLKLILRNHRNLKELNEKVVIENFLSFYNTDLVRLAQRIFIPTFLIVGESDPISPLPQMKELHKNIANSTMEIVPHGGHLLPLEQPASTAGLIKQFLDKDKESDEELGLPIPLKTEAVG